MINYGEILHLEWEGQIYKLYWSGIFTDQSEFRVHVCFKAGQLFIFRCEEGRRSVVRIDPQQKGRGARPAHQPGVEGPTAYGWPVSITKINGIKVWDIPEDILAEINARQSEDVSLLGGKAIEVFSRMNKRGVFRDFLALEIVTDKARQIEGRDIVSQYGDIEVKCDFNGGDNRRKGTGNLFLQAWERNPLKKLDRAPAPIKPNEACDNCGASDSLWMIELETAGIITERAMSCKKCGMIDHMLEVPPPRPSIRGLFANDK